MTPCNLSPCIIDSMTSATPPSFLTSAGAVAAAAAAAAQEHHPHSSLEDVDPSWKLQFQLLVSDGSPSQLISALSLLPKLYRVRSQYECMYIL